MGHRIGIVNYLELEPKPVLRHEVCDACGARFWGRRNACACCGGEAFHVKDAPDTGVLRAVAFGFIAVAEQEEALS